MREASACEPYSFGDGFCVLEVAGPRRSATLVRSSCPAPLWLCPLGAPLALALLPKAGSTTMANWAGRLGRLQGRWAALRAAAAGGGDGAAGELAEARLSNRSLPAGARATPALLEALRERMLGPRSGKLEVALRRSTAVFSELRERSGAMDIVVPAVDCPTCCEPRAWRTKVVVVRHPLARLVSYFGMAWAGNQRRGNFSSWRRLRPWLLHVAGAAPSAEVASSFGPEDEFHTLSLASFLAGHGSKPEDAIALRLESLEEDLRSLERELCRRHGHCRPLPLPSKRRLEATRPETPVARGRQGPALVQLWADVAVRDAILAAYAGDFEALGYDPEGRDLRGA